MTKIEIKEELYKRTHFFRINGSVTKLQMLLSFGFLMLYILNIKSQMALLLSSLRLLSAAITTPLITTLNLVTSGVSSPASICRKVLPFAGTISSFFSGTGTASQLGDRRSMIQEVALSGSLKNYLSFPDLFTIGSANSLQLRLTKSCSTLIYF